MTRAYGRCPIGQRLVCKTPWGHWKTTTFICGLRCDGLMAPWVLDGPMNGDAFRVYIEQELAPTLSAGDIVVMDNLPSHKVSGIREAIEDQGRRPILSTAYSPDLNLATRYDKLVANFAADVAIAIAITGWAD